MSCIKYETDGVPFSPSVGIEYIDKAGNNIMQELNVNSAGISVVNNANIFEIISILDEKDKPVEISKITIGGKRPTIAFRILEGYSSHSPVTECRYKIKYKIPPILGKDTIEEVILSYKVDRVGGFTDVWYNNEKCKPVRFSLVSDADGLDDVEALEKFYNYLYTGETISYFEDSRVIIIIPVEK
jgi:hypothetical protein